MSFQLYKIAIITERESRMWLPEVADIKCFNFYLFILIFSGL